MEVSGPFPVGIPGVVLAGPVCEKIATHLSRAKALGRADASLEAEPSGRDGRARVIFSAPRRAGFFFNVAGALCVENLLVEEMALAAWNTGDPVAVAEVARGAESGAWGQRLDARVWERVRLRLNLALSGQVNMAALILEHQARWRRPSWGRNRGVAPSARVVPLPDQGRTLVEMTLAADPWAFCRAGRALALAEMDPLDGRMWMDSGLARAEFQVWTPGAADSGEDGFFQAREWILAALSGARAH
jgi:hypothetical protein